MSTDIFDFECSAGTSGHVKHNVRRAQFGDGYGQVAKDGINSRTSTWQIELGPMRSDDASEITDWIDAHAGQSFFWTPPGKYMPGRFVCSDYTVRPDVADLHAVSAEFVEVFFP